MNGLVAPGIHVWQGLVTPPLRPRPALFVDRDGTLMVDTGYPRHPDEVALLTPSLQAFRLAVRLGLPVVVVTNQSGIARGLITWPDYEAVSARLREALTAAGIELAMIVASAWHPEGRAGLAHPDHPMQKPNPGMLLLAARTLNIDLGRSLIVGDSVRDLEAGRRAGLGSGFLIGTQLVLPVIPGFAITGLQEERDWDLLSARIIDAARPQ